MHEYASAPIGGLTYDANGNLLTINQGQPNAQEFGYDAQDQLVRHVAHRSGWQTTSGSWTTTADSASGTGRIVKARDAGFDTLHFSYKADTVSTDTESYGFAAVRAGTDANGCLVYVGVKIRGTSIELVSYGPSGETPIGTLNVTTEADSAYALVLDIDRVTGAVTLQRVGDSASVTGASGAAVVNPDMLVLGTGTATSYSFTNVETYKGGAVQGEPGPVTTTFQYDAFGRKVRKIVEDGVRPIQTTRYAYSGWQVVEEQDNTGTPKASYVYGRYIDEPIQMKRGDDTTVYYHSDDLYNVTALTNTDGNVVERYRYDDFGAPHVYDPSTAAERPASTYGNPYMFTGRAYDTDLQLYDYRTRHLHTGLGRFTTRDRIGLWGDPVNTGNPYSYVGNTPGRFVDPYGRTSLWNWMAEGLAQHWPYRYEPVIGFDPVKLAEMLSPAKRDELMPGYTQEDLQDRGALRTTTSVVRWATNDMLDRVNANLSMTPFGGLAAGSLVVHAAVKGEQGEYGSAALDGGAIILGGISATGKLLESGASACPAATEAAEKTTRLWRAVNPAELADLAKNEGIFRISEKVGGGIKYFSKTLEGAQDEAKLLAKFGDGPYTVVETTFPVDQIADLAEGVVDEGVDALVIARDLLHFLSPAKGLTK